MTDNEIIKALECCSYPIQVCNECPIPNDIRDNCKCMGTLCENALDLIHRQKAEIERLQNEVFAKEQECIDMQEQRDNVEYNLELLKQEKSVVKAEAVKEFAERVKDFMNDVPMHSEEDFIYVDYFELRDKIDNLVKEMVGEG